MSREGIYFVGHIQSNISSFHKGLNSHINNISAHHFHAARERDRACIQNSTAEIKQGHLKINNRLDATTYDGGGGDDSRRCNFKAVGLELVVRAAVLMPEAN